VCIDRAYLWRFIYDYDVYDDIDNYDNDDNNNDNDDDNKAILQHPSTLYKYMCINIQLFYMQACIPL